MTSTGGQEPPDQDQPDPRLEPPALWRDTVDPAEPNPVTEAMVTPRPVASTGAPDGPACHVCGAANHAGATHCLNCGVQLHSRADPGVAENEPYEVASDSEDEEGSAESGESVDSDGFIDPDAFAELRSRRSAIGGRAEERPDEQVDEALEEREAQRTLHMALAALMVVAALALFIITFGGDSKPAGEGTSTTTTVIDLTARYRDLIASLADRVDQLAAEAGLVNDRWDARTTDYATTLADLQSIASSTQPLEATIREAELPPAADLRLQSRLSALAATLADSANDMVEGLESADSGETRLAALIRYSAAADEFSVVAASFRQILEDTEN